MPYWVSQTLIRELISGKERLCEWRQVIIARRYLTMKFLMPLRLIGGYFELMTLIVFMESWCRIYNYSEGSDTSVLVRVTSTSNSPATGSEGRSRDDKLTEGSAVQSLPSTAMIRGGCHVCRMLISGCSSVKLCPHSIDSMQLKIGYRMCVSLGS